MNLRLGEGSGAAIALHILKAALATHNGMSTFDNAKVSKKIISWKKILKNRVVLDFFASLMFFTRIPVNWKFFSNKPPNLTNAAWSFPLIGYIIGIISESLVNYVLTLIYQYFYLVR